MAPEVLLVEDEGVVVESVTRVLRPEGLGVRSVGDVASALEELRRESFAVVLCDLMLPGGSGLEVLETVAESHPAAQVVTITGYSTCDNALESFRRGAFDFLPKPFDADELLAVVRRALRCSGLAAREAVAAEAEARPARHRLGRHAWALVDSDGSATLGVGEAFSRTLDALDGISVTGAGEHTVQCQPFATLVDGEGMEHRVWAPLSGRVLAVNEAVAADPELILRDPLGIGWLIRIVPESSEEELAKLVSR